MSATSFGDRVLARVVDDDLVAGLNKPPCHVRAHIAETDEADVHGKPPLSISLAS
jgi:hypothetical protein